MLLRTFLARDMRDAIYRVHREMGPDAIIVSNHRAKNGVMVRAALDKVANPGRGPTQTAREDPTNVAFIGTFEQIFGIGEVTPLRSPPQIERQNESFGRTALLRILAYHRVPGALAHPLAEAAAKSGSPEMIPALAAALSQRVRSAPIIADQRKALLLMGSYGAGKTTIAAKIAAQLKLAERPVLLIAAATAQPGRAAQLEDYARQMHVPLAIAGSAEEIAAQVSQAQKRDTVAIVDTAPLDPRDAKARSAFAALSEIPDAEALGVVTAAGDAEEASDITAALLSLGMERLVVTGLDATRRLGALVAAATQGAGLAHTTSSPLLAGGLDVPTPLSLARSIVETSLSERSQP